MKSNYNDCLQHVLKYEGGYTNDPNDAGGPTNFGITLGDYRKYINSKGTATDVKEMSVDQAKVIYKARYWDALGCDNLPSGVDFTCFDYGVNSGLRRPQNDLKKFSNLSGVKLINAINDERMSFLRGLSNWGTFGGGWSKRVSDVRSHSIQLATQKNTTTGPAIAVGTVAGGSYLSHVWHDHFMLIIVGSVVAASAIGYAIHAYLNKGKQ
jgi:lysozyme family protein